MVANPMAPVPLIVIPVPPVKPRFVRADEVEVRSPKLFEAMSCRAFARLSRPSAMRAVDVLVRSERLFATTSCRAFERFPNPMFVRALEVFVRSDKLFAARRAPPPPVLETFAGVQKLPFQVRTWFVDGAVEETALPWMPITVWDVELPERSPPAVKLPMPHPTQFPLTTRFWSVVVDPVIVTVPGKVAVMPDLPIVMPVAEDAPMEMVPVASMMLFESPVMLVPLKVSAAKATDAPASTMTRHANAPITTDRRTGQFI